MSTEDLFKTLKEWTVQSKFTALDLIYDRSLPGRRIHCIVCSYGASYDTFNTLTAECQFSGGRLERYLCPRCGALFGPMKMLDMPEAELSNDYQLLYSTYAEGDSTAAEIRTFMSLKPEKGKSYLNWGSGAWSKCIPQMRAKGYDLWGYEPFADLKENAGYVVTNRGEISASFDGVFTNDVVEHFRQPVAQFKDMAAVLKPGGLMAHSTPCYEYKIADTRYHTVFYLGNSLDSLASRIGFEVVGREKDGEYMNRVLRQVTK